MTALGGGCSGDRLCVRTFLRAKAMTKSERPATRSPRKRPPWPRHEIPIRKLRRQPTRSMQVPSRQCPWNRDAQSETPLPTGRDATRIGVIESGPPLPSVEPFHSYLSVVLVVASQGIRLSARHSDLSWTSSPLAQRQARHVVAERRADVRHRRRAEGQRPVPAAHACECLRPNYVLPSVV
jgi:hypothetical protein